MRSLILFLLFLSHWTYSQNTYVDWVTTLSSEQFSGRGPYNSGDSLAAEYIQNVFIENQLKVNKQSFSDKVVFIDKTPELQFNNQLKLVFGQDFVVNPSSKPGTYKAKSIIVSGDANCLSKKKCWKNKAVVVSTKTLALLMAEEVYKKKIAEAKVLIELIEGTPYSNMAQDNSTMPHVRLKTTSFTFSKRVNLTISSHVEKRTFYNVIGRLEGASNKTIIVSAHYDHLGKVGDVMFPGANDNASGVATLFSLMSYYKAKGLKPESNLMFIAFGAEEIGLLGSKYYAEHSTSLDSIDFVLNLDLLGAGSKGLMIQNAPQQEYAFNLLKNINEEKNYVVQLKSRANAPNSDHWPFTQKGVDAVFLYSLGKVGGYHNQYDTVDKLEKGYISNIKKLILDFLSQY